MIFGQNAPSLSPRRYLARNALPRERFRSLPRCGRRMCIAAFKGMLIAASNNPRSCLAATHAWITSSAWMVRPRPLVGFILSTVWYFTGI
jgi:hypothetical protein